MDTFHPYEIGQIVELPLDRVKVDNSLNPREGALDQELVLRYLEILDDLPPMPFFLLGGEFVHIGGFHRRASHELGQRATGRFEYVGTGSRDEAQEKADFDNLRHGKRLGQKEERAVRMRHVKRHPERSDSWLARELGASDKSIRSIRLELEERSEIPILDKLIDQNGIERPRSIERPPRPDPQAEAEKLTAPFEQWAERLETGPAEADDARVTRFKAQACPDCQSEEFYWQDPETVACYICGRKWEKLAWMRRHAPAGMESREAVLAEEPQEGQAAIEGEPKRYGLAGFAQEFGIQAPQPAESQPAGEPEWLAETGDVEAENAELDRQAAELAAAPRVDYSPPVREFKATAPAPKPPPPPPPPPTIGRAPLSVSFTLYPNGNALIVERKGETGMGSKSVQVSALMWELQQLVDGYLSKEEPVNDNAV